MPGKWYRPVAVGFQRESIHFNSDDLEELSGGDGHGLDFKDRHVIEANLTLPSGEPERLRPWMGLGC